MKDYNGRILTEKQAVKGWNEYFEKLVYVEN